MKFNIQSLEKKLNKIDETSKNIDKFEHYEQMNERYKSFISGYSKSYIEMSDWYYGEELPYHIYCKLFQKKNENNINLKGTYFESKEDLIELYKLFLFYGFIDTFMNYKIGV